MTAPVRANSISKSITRRDDPVLRQGSNGASVARLQRLLAARGANPGPIDGDFGPKTEAAVKRFQRAHHLNDTGVAGQQTWDWLERPAQKAAAFKKAHPVFHSGDHSKLIETAEKNLKALGYDIESPDRTMDAETVKALEAFRADEGSKVKAGVMGMHVRAELDKAVDALKHNPYHSRVKPSKQHRRLDAATAAAVQKTFDGQLGLGEGVKGRSVKNVQLRLKAAGYDPSRTDGTFDERTAGAVKAFQRRSGLTPTGRVDAGTWKKLKDAYVYAKSGTSPSQTIGERSGAVRKSEQVLRKLGYKRVKADGTFDAKTASAVRAFERKHKLHVDGRIGTHDLKVMRRSLGVHASSKMKQLVRDSRSVAMSMGGFSSQGLCATGVSRAIQRTFGIFVGGNGNQIDNNLPRSKFKQVHMSLEKALKVPGLILTWEHTSTTLGSRFGHTAITWGDGHTTSSDFIERFTSGAGRTGLKIFMAR